MYGIVNIVHCNKINLWQCALHCRMRIFSLRMSKLSDWLHILRNTSLEVSGDTWVCKISCHAKTVGIDGRLVWRKWVVNISSVWKGFGDLKQREEPRWPRRGHRYWKEEGKEKGERRLGAGERLSSPHPPFQKQCLTPSFRVLFWVLSFFSSLLFSTPELWPVANVPSPHTPVPSQ